MSLRSEAIDLIDELVAYEEESIAGAVAIVGFSPMSTLVEGLSLREHVERGGLEGGQLRLEHLVDRIRAIRSAPGKAVS
jgi:hypothetical protein